MLPAVKQEETGTFGEVYLKLEDIVGELMAAVKEGRRFNEVVDLVGSDGRELQRLLLQSYLDEGGLGDVGREVVSSTGDEHERGRVRPRKVMTVFGEVEVSRRAYERTGGDSLHPRDGQLNLPRGLHDYGVCKVVAYEVAKGSFDEAVDSLRRQTGASMSKSTAEEIAQSTAADFETFYAQWEPPPGGIGPGHAVVMSCDGAAIVMLPEDLREPTRRAAEADEARPDGLLDQGEKRNRKRRAMVTAVYGIKLWPRTPDDILPLLDEGEAEAPRPKPLHKRVAATLEDPVPAVSAMFDAADQLDPRRECPRIALVDGDPYQIDLIMTEAARRGVEVQLILDVFHLAEYFANAGRALHCGVNRQATNWARAMLWLLLAGYADEVLHRIAEARQTAPSASHKALGALATYLTNHRHMIDYDRYLAAGFPVGSGVVEGACRHLVRNRLDRSGARWSLDGGEAVLKLRALYLNGDFDDYWEFHLMQEHQRNHASHYADPETVAPTSQSSASRRQPPYLYLVKS
jgi:hypothetical protein